MKDHTILLTLIVCSLGAAITPYIIENLAPEPRFKYVVAYESCGGLQDTVEIEGYGNDLEIRNYRRAVPELVLRPGAIHKGYMVAYNVCSFTIISKTPVQ